MTASRLFSAALLMLLMLMPSCLPERTDSRYPTVSQQDAYDVSWGLPARKSRGNPKHVYQYKARADEAVQPAAPAPQAPITTPAPSRPAAPAPAPISPKIPAGLGRD